MPKLYLLAMLAQCHMLLSYAWANCLISLLYIIIIIVHSSWLCFMQTPEHTLAHLIVGLGFGVSDM